LTLILNGRNLTELPAAMKEAEMLETTSETRVDSERESNGLLLTVEQIRAARDRDAVGSDGPGGDGSGTGRSDGYTE
jgi:hypothetical protein